MSEGGDEMETVEVQTVAGTTPAVVEPAGGEELGKVRELVLKAHPDVVPDLVRGSSVDELITSVEPARGAYQRIVERVRAETGASGGVGRRESEVEPSDVRPATADPIVQPPVVPAGGGTNVADPGDLGPTTKIAQALAARQQR